MNPIQMDQSTVYFFKALIFISIFFGALASAKPAKLQAYWQASNETNQFVVDHSSWQRFLDRYVLADKSGQTFVKYAKVDSNGFEQLANYLNYLQGINPLSLNRKEQMAYWINLYNALTIKLVLEEYPVKTIKAVKGGLFNLGPWGDEVIHINEKYLSLDDIEHGILRPIWQDDRIHYAVNCAALGCPNLAQTAYTSENLESILDAQREDFINHPRGVKISSGQLELSSIFKWYLKDFATDEKALKVYLAKYANETFRAELQAHDGDIRYHYNWSLNESPKQEKTY